MRHTARLVLAANLLCSTVQAQQPPQALAPGLWLIPGSFPRGRNPDGNTVVFEGTKGLVVMDTGRHPWHRQAILAFSARRGRPISAIVNSHWHLDHSSGNLDIQRAHPQARLFTGTAVERVACDLWPASMARAQERLDSGKVAAGEAEDMRLDLETRRHPQALLPAAPITASGRRDVGGVALDLRLARDAATEGDVWAWHASSRTVVAGDLVTLPVPFLDTACVSGWGKALEAIAATPFVRLVPGHGRPMARPQLLAYRAAFKRYTGCARSSDDAASCAAGWMSDTVALRAPEPADDPRAMEMARDYVELLRANSGDAPGCRLPFPPAMVSTHEPDIAQLQAAMAQGRLSAEQLTRDSLARIRRADGGPRGLHAVLETNPEAIAISRRLDQERRAGSVRGPLHGIPVLVKDNLDTGDRMLTTAGSLALMNAPASEDAFVVRRLREAGAVLLGKTNLSEWANIRSSKSSSGWSARGGQTGNPYGAGRNPCGSSSGTGTAIAAGYAPAGIGTETDGSIVCPSSVAGLVGIKPTVGLVSRSGIVPIAASQDTAGPMTRHVADAAIVLNAIAGIDASDAATEAAKGHIPADYRAFLTADGLKGARIGVARKKVTGYSPRVDRLFEQAIADLRRLGAEVVDPADFGSIGEYDEDELEVLLYELKDGLNRYLAGRNGVPVRTLADVIAFNERHADREMPWFGQELFVKAQAKGPLTDAAYLQAAAKARKLAREGIDGVLRAHRLDAIIAPTTGPAWLTDHVNGDAYQGSSSSPAAVAGYPSITLPMGTAQGLPVGLSFVGTAWSEGRLLQLAYAYEQATRHRAQMPVLAK